MRDSERWFHLCQLASVEQDRAKALALFQEMGRLLDEEGARLSQKRGDMAEPPVLPQNKGRARQKTKSAEDGSN
jgi:hypothetical protein